MVQQSFPDPRPTTNPYIVMLKDALDATDGVELRTFSWRRALLGKYDVFHSHWPEILVGGATPLKQLVRQGLFVLLLLRFRLQRIAVVRTQHNLELPQGITRRERILLGWFDRATTLRIALNEHTPIPAGQPYHVIVHGHYRDWFAKYGRATPRPGRIGYFGKIRRYKNVGALVRAFVALEGPYELMVAGDPSSEALVAELRALAAGDDRVTLRFDFLTDGDLVQVATSSELVVLPYSHMHNSGGVLAGLSLAVPVLVPATEVNAALADEVGPGWVYQYDGQLDVAVLAAAIRSVRSQARTQPDLSRREWIATGELHLQAYRDAVALRRR